MIYPPPNHFVVLRRHFPAYELLVAGKEGAKNCYYVEAHSFGDEFNFEHQCSEQDEVAGEFIKMITQVQKMATVLAILSQKQWLAAGGKQQ